MNEKKFSETACFFKLGFITLFYLIFEGFYTSNMALSLDDFWLGYHNYQYQSALPYRDFSPYKTVLGYYLLLIPLTFFHGILKPLIFTKFSIAIINAFFMIILTFWLRKFFEFRAVIYALLLVILMQIFLFYSVDIRVDIIAYWFCLIAILFILEEKYLFSGLTIVLAFLITQKAIWYIVAINFGLFCHWILEERYWRMLKKILIFNFFLLFIISLYIIFWAHFSSFEKVLNSVFYEAYLVASNNWFQDIKDYYWRFIINNNPGLVLIFPIAFLSLFIFPLKKRAFIIGCTVAVIVLMSHSKQLFPYYFLIGLPIYWIVYSAFFSAILSKNEPNSRMPIFVFAFLYFIGLLFLSLRFSMPFSYLIAFFIPVASVVLYSSNSIFQHAFIHQLIIGTFLLLGVVFPMIIAGILFSQSEGQYQKSMVYLVKDLLSTGGTYIAGFPLFHDIKQAVPGLEHIVGPSVAYLNTPTKELRELMKLKSLYFSTDTIPEIIESIKHAPIKLYLDNNRFHFLPKEIHGYLASQYQHFWGSVFLYAPRIKPGEKKIHLKFSGIYKIEAEKNAQIYMNKQKIVPGSLISLQEHNYFISSNKAFRLRLIPEQLKHSLNPEFRANHWEKVLSWN